MPKRTDIKSILIIGAGPIVIGQACEFDYSGTQAVKTLKEEGYRVILVNSNPATIMTDPELADATYVEPITPEFVEKIIEVEKPDALLPTMGGQTALNCAKNLAESGALEKHGVELIGARLEAINKAEDRELFNDAMERIGLEVPKNAVVRSLEEALRTLDMVGLPAIIRPSFTLGGSGGGIAYNREEFEEIVKSGLDASPVGEVLIDESVLGWKEYEMEVVRDQADNCIIICSIENVDPMGVHTGDSITVAPALTLTDKEYQIMRDASLAVLREIGVDTGGSNVQFAVNPEDGRLVVIEMNPRVSRSSALASKATGFPIAKVAARLAVGYTLDEIMNDVVSPSPRRGEDGRGAETARTYPLKASIEYARELRANMTDAEKLMWKLLRSKQLGARFRKQHPLGKYIADFACLNPKLIIELDGGQHAEEAAIERDKTRTQFMEEQGFRVLRFRNHEVLQNTEGVLETIYAALHGQTSPHPVPPPEGEGIPASFEPTIDYVVTKIPRFTFEKFPGTEPLLSSSMKSVGEAMAIGRSFAESLQKALRSLETGLTGLNEVEIEGFEKHGKDALRTALAKPTPQRLLMIAQAFRAGMELEEIHRITHYDLWFLEQIAAIVQAEEEIRHSSPLNGEAGRGAKDSPGSTSPHPNPPPMGEGTIPWLRWKKMGFSDARLAELMGCSSADVRAARRKAEVLPVYKRIDTCAAEFASQTSYMYGCYEEAGFRIQDSGEIIHEPSCEAQPSDREKVVILGGGPNRIGQGIEFDYCCVHAAYALKEAGFETIMVNCNPETVSTDYDTSDRLYFEPLTDEDVFEILHKEQSKGTLKGVIVQFGGQMPLKLARALEQEFGRDIIIGTAPDMIDLAEDRDRFKQLLEELKLKQPPNAICRSVEEVMEMAESIGYPVVVRPSYVLGGRAMQIVHDALTLQSYIGEIISMFGDGPILLDGYLQNAVEVDVDALADGREVFVAGIMEHIEEAGVHSGDSACSLPPYSLSESTIAELKAQTVQLAKGLNVVGLMNVQYAVKDGEIYILEVNPRASRTVPFVSKTIGIPLAKIASRLMAGERLNEMLAVWDRSPPGGEPESASARSGGGSKTAKVKLPPTKSAETDLTPPQGGSGLRHIAVKEAVFPFARFPGVDTILGPEMKSTGEAMGLDTDFAAAFAKGQIAGGSTLPLEGCVFISVKEGDKTFAVDLGQRMVDNGFAIIATHGTARALEAAGLPVTPVNKVREGRPHIVDAIKDGKVQLVFNTTEGAQSIADSYSIRRTALERKVPYSTTIAGCRAIAMAIAARKSGRGLEVRALQSYFTEKHTESGAKRSTG